MNAQTPGRIWKVDPPIWGPVLLKGLYRNPHWDLLFGSSRGSGIVLISISREPLGTSFCNYSGHYSLAQNPREEKLKLSESTTL